MKGAHQLDMSFLVVYVFALPASISLAKLPRGVLMRCRQRRCCRPTIYDFKFDLKREKTNKRKEEKWTKKVKKIGKNGNWGKTKSFFWFILICDVVIFRFAIHNKRTKSRVDKNLECLNNFKWIFKKIDKLSLIGIDKKNWWHKTSLFMRLMIIFF